mgnify:FL=1|jgi:hypothetical protein
MTKKDYILIAKVLKDNKHLKIGDIQLLDNLSHTIDYHRLIRVLCQIFEHDNSRFDEDIFRKACGINTEEI